MQTDPTTPPLRKPGSPAGSAPQQPALREDAPTLALQRRAYRLLKQAATDTAKQRLAIEAAYAEQTSTATVIRDRAVKQAAEKRASLREEAEATCSQALQQASEAHTAALREADATRARDRDVARERGQRDVDASKQQRDEAVWFAETCLDTDRTKLKATRQNDLIQIGQLNGRVQLIKQQADQLLEQWRQNIAVELASVPTESAEPLTVFETAIGNAEKGIAAMQAYGAPKAIRGVAPWLIVFGFAFAGAIAAAWARHWAVDIWSGVSFLAAAALGGLLVTAIFFAVRKRTQHIVQPLAVALAEARGAIEAQSKLYDAADKQRNAEAKAKYDAEASKARAKHDATVKKVQERLADIGARVEEAHAAATQRAVAAKEASLESATTARDRAVSAADEAAAATTQAAEQTFTAQTANARADYESAWQKLAADWRAQTDRVTADLHTVEQTLALARTSWSALAEQETLQVSPTPTLEAATASLDIASLLTPLEGDPRLATQLPASALLPVPLEVPRMASLALLTSADQRQKGTDVLSAVMLRMLTTLPPGKARFTICDPVGLGQSFAGFMRLAEFATTGGSLVGERIWTEPRHIEQKLADITEHMETVIQKYLRNQYATIDQYNQAAGEVAEPYRFVVLADFPTNVSEIAAKRLESILASGPRCGVYVLLAATKKDNLPQGIKWTDVTRACHLLTHKDGHWRWDDADFAQLPLTVPTPPTPEQFSVIADRVGAAAMEASKVRVPFSSIAPPEPETWTKSTADGFSVPLGRAGATKLQQLALGQGTQQHVLIAGRTGSGKSTLLNVIITASALWYSPDEVELYLVDFKKGVEFKAYATTHLPHARVIAVESEREFGLSVLRKLDAELTRRGDLFRTAGTQSLSGYRVSPNAQVMPRVLLIVDEFQEFFIEDDKLAQESGLLLDRLVRQGRAFGMHVILGSQTLAGAYSLARSTIGQMGVRIALQCSEADSYLILADDNPAARLLNRPGEAIYNDASGMLEGNNPFQVCWLDEDDRAERINALHARVAKMDRPLAPAIVFEGNAPAQAEENPELLGLIASGPTARPGSYKFHLGSPISIKEPTGASFRRRSASNLLLVGQNEDHAMGMLGVGIIGLALQDTAAPAAQRSRTVLIDGTPADTSYAGLLPRTAEAAGSRVENVEYRAVPAAIAKLHEELKSRMADETGATSQPPVFLVIAGLQRFRTLQKSEDDFGFGGGDTDAPKPDKQLAELVREGPAVGIHTIVWCDSAANLERFFKRQSLSEFDSRVLLQMSVNDSSNLIDSPAAGNLGRDRALLFSEERGTVERFRPLAVPPDQWIKAAAAAIQTHGSIGQ